MGYPGHCIAYCLFDSHLPDFNIQFIGLWLAMAIIELVLETIILVQPIRKIYRLHFSSKKDLHTATSASHNNPQEQ